jgi:type II secretory pathway component HofQ
VLSFFKKSVQNNRTELLIFLTPRIISPKLNLG